MIGLYSYAVHLDAGVVLMYHGVSANVETKLGIALYCVDIIFNIVMVYGAHKVNTNYFFSSFPPISTYFGKIIKNLLLIFIHVRMICKKVLKLSKTMYVMEKP